MPLVILIAMILAVAPPDKQPSGEYHVSAATKHLCDQFNTLQILEKPDGTIVLNDNIRPDKMWQACATGEYEIFYVPPPEPGKGLWR